MFDWDIAIVTTHISILDNKTEMYWICRLLDTKEKGIASYRRLGLDAKLS